MIKIVVVIGFMVVAIGGFFYFRPSTIQPAKNEMIEKRVATPTVAMEKELVGEVREVLVVGGKTEAKPESLKLTKGENIRLTFRNTEGRHVFLIDELEIKTGVLGEGEEEEFEFGVETPGTFDVKMIVE